MLILSIGLITEKFWESIVFCFTRLFTGGYHAPNHILCKVIFGGTLLAILAAGCLLKGIEDYYWFILHFCCSVIVCQFAPIENTDGEFMKKLQ